MQRSAKHPHRSKRVLYLIGAALSLLVGFVMIVVWSYWKAQSKLSFRAGVSFSVKYAHELGIDPRETMTALVNDLGVRHFRLMSYWDLGEPIRGQYDFTDLDWQMKLAEQSGSKVSLAIGLRQPRWPECHAPVWASALSKADQRQALKDYMGKVIERYRGSMALESYQLENEALNTAFGACNDFDRARLTDEFNYVKQLDPSHPIAVSVSNEYGLPLGAPRGDLVGFSVYHRVFDSTVTHRYVEYPIPAWYHGFRAAFIHYFIGRETFIHELQGEPWGPQATVKLSIDEQNKSMDAARLAGRVGYAKATGIRDFDLWGAEWWYWRKTKFHDSSLWDTARHFFGPDLQTTKCCSTK